MSRIKVARGKYIYGIVSYYTHLLQQPQGGLKVQDSCWRKSSKLHLTRQRSQQLHSGDEEVNLNGEYNDFHDSDLSRT